MSDNKMSFLPEDYVEKRREQRTNLVCLVLFGVVLIGMVGAFVAQGQQKVDVKRERLRLDTEYTDAAKRIEQYELLQTRRAEMIRKAQVTASLVDPLPRSFLLADLVNQMPQSLSLLELDLHTKLIQPPRPVATKAALAKGKAKTDKKSDEPPPAPKAVVSLVMVGVAPTDVQVAQYMSRLTQSPLLSDVSLIFTEELKVADSVMRKFRIEMVLNEKADIRALEPQPDPARPRNPLQDSGLPPVTGRGPVPVSDAGGSVNLSFRAED
jgi:Tfp pilus assembly protein PilN